jgi:hypothetical protein
MNGDAAIAQARAEGFSVSVEDLGDWHPAHLLSECDAATKSIRVNARVVERLARKGGDELAQWFLACAVAHEMYHLLVPGATEDEAHGFAMRQTGTTTYAFEAMLDGC